MTGEGWSSGFAGHIEDMLAWRRAVGLGHVGLGREIRSFDEFCAREHPGLGDLTRELAVEWFGAGRGDGWSAWRVLAVRQLGQYLQMAGADAFVAPASWAKQPTPGLPHMFTDDELTAFFAAADSLAPVWNSPFREHIVPVVFRLILGCGLRPQEARGLSRSDVDVDAAALTVRHAKHGKERRLAIAADLADALRRYDQLAEARDPGRERFFEVGPGQGLGGQWLARQYHLCRRLAGGVAPGSTPYTLRHNYATRTLTRWVEEGRDLGAWLPYLSAHMGHETYKATAHYIHLLPERLAAAGLNNADGVIPEVAP
jgi:integrase